MTRISVFGLGPVGLVRAVCFARKGYQMVGIDPDRERLEKIQRTNPPFSEPKLKEYLEETITKGTFSVADDASANSQAVLAFITVGTPSCEDGSIDSREDYGVDTPHSCHVFALLANRLRCGPKAASEHQFGLPMLDRYKLPLRGLVRNRRRATLQLPRPSAAE